MSMEASMEHIRIQFDLPIDLWKRAKRYIKKDSARHVFGFIAFEEWLNRREGRDKKLKTELLLSDMEILRPILKELLEEMK